MTLGEAILAARTGRRWNLSDWYKDRGDEPDWMRPREELQREEPRRNRALPPKGKLSERRESRKLTEEIDAAYDEELEREDEEFLRYAKRYHRRILGTED